MHAPDGFLEPSVAIITAVIALVAVSAGVRYAGRELGDRQVPLAGVAAAFIFAAQMVNFPVAAGTTGHLLGGALAAVLLGPWVGMLVVSVVVIVQAVLFADGGLTALGYNTINMAIVTAFGGWAAFVVLRKLMPRTPQELSVQERLRPEYRSYFLRLRSQSNGCLARLLRLHLTLSSEPWSVSTC